MAGAASEFKSAEVTEILSLDPDRDLLWPEYKRAPGNSTSGRIDHNSDRTVELKLKYSVHQRMWSSVEIS